MTNSRLLASKMVAFGDTSEDIANYLGISKPTFLNKKNGKLEFKQLEIYKIKERYNLNAKEIDSIFFTE